MKIDQLLINRFNSKVNSVPDKNGCWNWTGSCADYRYGQIKAFGVFYKAHRLSYEIHKGKIPAGFHVCHTCDNPKCVNPAHLWLGTHQDNMKDRATKKRGNTPSGEACGKSKLTEKEVKQIRAEYKINPNQSELARRFNVTSRTICYIVHHKTWKQVTE